MNRIRHAVKFTFCPRPRPRTSRTRMSNLPHAPKVWMLSWTTLRSTFCLLFPRLFLTLLDTLRNSGRGKNERPLPSRFSRPTVLFSAQVTCSPARLRVFLCPRFSAENDARGVPNRDGISTRVRFGSVLPSGEMSTKARSAVIWGLGELPGLAPSSRPSASSPLGDPTRLQRHLTATARTTTGVKVRNVKDSIYTLELISFNFNVELTRFYVFVVVYRLCCS